MLTGQSWTATTDATGAAKFSAVKTGSTYATGWSYSASSLATTIVTKETAAGATTAVETGRWTAAYATNGDLTRVTNINDGSRFGRATQHDGHGRLIAGTTSSGTAVSMRFNERGRLAEYKNDILSMRFQWTAFGELQRIDGPGTDVVVYEYDAAQRLTGVRKQLTYAAYDNSTLTRFAQSLRKLFELPISSAHAQATLPLTPVPSPLRRAARPAAASARSQRYFDAILVAARSEPGTRAAFGRIAQHLDRPLVPLARVQEAASGNSNDAERNRWRHFSMVVDKNNLFCTQPTGRNSWRGHEQQHSDKQTLLRKQIDRAKAINCPYNPEADDWANRLPPICPGRDEHTVRGRE